jgi:hypothetical protein
LPSEEPAPFVTGSQVANDTGHQIGKSTNPSVNAQPLIRLPRHLALLTVRILKWEILMMTRHPTRIPLAAGARGYAAQPPEIIERRNIEIRKKKRKRGLM